MGTSGKKKTTMAKLARESRLRERRMLKQAKKNDRRSAPASTDHPDQHEVVLRDTAVSPTGPAQADLEDAGLPSGEARRPVASDTAS